MKSDNKSDPISFYALTDAGELKTLAELNISQIGLNASQESGLVRDGNEILAIGTFIQNGLSKLPSGLALK